MRFRIAHFSDPHLSPAPFPLGRELRLKRFLGWVNWKRDREGLNDMEMLDRLVADARAQGPDHIAMTGDAVNLALRHEFARAQRWMNSLGAAQDVSFTPGNHDAYVRDALPALAETFAPWTEGYRFPYLRRRGEIALIGLNSGVPTLPFLATGRLGQAQLDEFARMLRETAGLARVVMIHHPPMQGGRAPRLRGLDDAGAFEAVVAEHGAELILHGHTHRVMANRLPSPASRNAAGFVPVLGAPSISAAAPDPLHRACYYLIDVAKEGAQWRTSWRAREMSRGSGEIADRAPPSA
ncbi:MAG: metallophosphoesterase [Pseudomonadota bacterium]|nr:metallophosphoesterase [Pseudomonadota bacterium]